MIEYGVKRSSSAVMRDQQRPENVNNMSSELRRTNTVREIVNSLTVGGRHGPSPLGQWGGGYPDNCTPPGFAVTAAPAGGALREAELADIDLPPIWRAVAAEVGADTFLRVWQTLANPAVVDSAHRVYVPRFSTYLIYQRNKYIVALACEGKSSAEISKYLANAGINLKKNQINRIVRRSMQRAASSPATE